MKAKTLYVSDMDGTLLGQDSQLSQETVDILNDLIDNHDVLFTVATARTPATVVPLLSRVHTRLPFIVLAGAAQYEPTAHTYVDSCVISNDVVQRIVGIFEAHGLHPLIYRRLGDMLHVYHNGSLSVQEQQFVAERQGLELKKFHLADTQYATRPGDTLLIFSMQRFEVLQSVAAEIEAAHISCMPMVYHDIFDHDTGFLEIYAAGSTKAAAIQRLAARLGAERTVVFGDNLNDLPMMQAATVSVAVDNAFPQVKQAATTIIGPNTEHSVARFIKADALAQ